MWLGISNFVFFLHKQDGTKGWKFSTEFLFILIELEIS